MKARPLELVRLYCVAVALAGVALLATLVVATPVDTDGRAIEFAALFVCVLIGELFPLELPRRSGDGEVTVSVMFSFALLLGLGLVPALAAQLVASIVQDRVARKPWWQVGFNIGQYTLSLAAAAGVLSFAGIYGALHTNGFRPVDLLAVLGAAAAYFTVNLLLVTRATTLYQGIPFARALRVRSDLRAVGRSAVLLCLAPVVVTVLRVQPDPLPAPARPARGRVHQRPPERPHGHGRASRPPRQPDRAAQPALVPGVRRRGAREPVAQVRRAAARRPRTASRTSTTRSATTTATSSCRRSAPGCGPPSAARTSSLASAATSSRCSCRAPT